MKILAGLYLLSGQRPWFIPSRPLAKSGNAYKYKYKYKYKHKYKYIYKYKYWLACICCLDTETRGLGSFLADLWPSEAMHSNRALGPTLLQAKWLGRTIHVCDQFYVILVYCPQN